MAASYTFSDHSGIDYSAKQYDNPYEPLLDQCNNDPTAIQDVYHKHRTNRNAQQKQKLLAEDFKQVTIDEILAKLEHPEAHPGYVDPRNCLVFWARPTHEVKALIQQVQNRLKSVVPGLWTMPQDNLHMTALEVSHSLTAPEIDQLIDILAPKAADITDYPLSHRSRLVKPLVSFDAQAIALSFLPAAGEPGRAATDDSYTYHHLRRDIYTQVRATGMDVASRYVVPSAHLTIARFIRTSDFEKDGQYDRSKMEAMIQAIDDINAWLQEAYWSVGKGLSCGWLVGEERGLTYQKGMLWYGGGETVHQGRGY